MDQPKLTVILNKFASLWLHLSEQFINLSWILDGVASGFVIYVMANVFLYGYREHRYLYQFEDQKRAVQIWVKFLRPFAMMIQIPRYQQWVKLHKSQAAFMPEWDLYDFIAYQVLLALLAGVISFVAFVTLLGGTISIAIGAAAAGFVYPLVSISDAGTKRQRSCFKDLPFFIDYLCLAMGAGLDFSQALSVVLEDAPKTPLAKEFSLAMKNMRLGMTRADALIMMDERMENPNLKLFLQTMVQAMELGTDVNQTLQALSDTFRAKRFQHAEEMAGKISVRMMIPMMVFILPAVMIMLIGPMLLNSPLSGM
ncbi:MAG: type II secretion system F family protein [Proteobacteria bacterium]|nr:type II secretion system F family protein [Pseudomonadota bacterium]